MGKKIAVLLAPGFEDIEAIGAIDVFRRAGITVSLLGVKNDGAAFVTSSHGVKLMVDGPLSDAALSAGYDLVYLPGGLPGATNLAASQEVGRLARAVRDGGGILAAICAAPIALDAAGVLDDVDFTCYPGFEKNIKSGNYTGARVQRCGKVITGCGPGATLEMAFEILRMMGLNNAAGQLMDAMQVRR